MVSRQLIAGMPGSGKTTFIAALRHLLNANRVPTSMVFDGFADSEKHLNRLEEKWLACEEVDRTPAISNAWPILRLKDTATGNTASIAIPDISGEAFRQIAITGRCRRSIYDAMVESSGLLLFTNADRAADNTMIVDEVGLAGELGGDEVGGGGDDMGGAARFDPEQMPEETNLVELLQVMNRRPLASRQRLLAVMVSAWDVLQSTNVEPEEWFQMNRPMLWRYTTSNPDLWTLRVYGVSAQGGKFPAQREKLQVLEPSRRIQVIGREVKEHDLTAPIHWVLGGRPVV